MRRMNWVAVAVAALMTCSVALAAEEGGRRKGKGKEGGRRGPDVAKLLERFDKSGNGELEADELGALLEAMAKRRRGKKAGEGEAEAPEKEGPKKPTPEGLLAKFDKDGSGGLNAEELGAALRALRQRRGAREGGREGGGRERGGKRKGGEGEGGGRERGGKRKGGEGEGV